MEEKKKRAYGSLFLLFSYTRMGFIFMQRNLILRIGERLPSQCVLPYLYDAARFQIIIFFLSYPFAKGFFFSPVPTRRILDFKETDDYIAVE